MRNLNLLFILFFYICQLQAQTSHYVNPSQYRAPEHFANLSTAVAAAQAGDTIYLHPGSAGGATLDKRLHLVGPGYNITSNNDKYIVNVSMGNAVITTLNLNAGADSSSVSGVQVNEINCNNINGAKIYRNRIIDQVKLTESDGILIFSNWFSGTNDVCLSIQGFSNQALVSNNLFTYFNSTSSFWSLTLASGSDANIAHNVFNDRVSIGDNTIFTNNISTVLNKDALSKSGTAVVQYNIFARNETEVATANIIDYGNSGIFVGYPSGNGLSFDARYELAPGSPAIGYASDGGDCGVFDGPFPYKLSGVSARPLITDFNISDVAPNNGMLQVTIKANAQN